MEDEFGKLNQNLYFLILDQIKPWHNENVCVFFCRFRNSRYRCRAIVPAMWHRSIHCRQRRRLRINYRSSKEQLKRIFTPHHNECVQKNIFSCCECFKNSFKLWKRIHSDHWMQTFSEENAWNRKQIITVETKKNLNNKEEKNHLPNCGRLNDFIFFSAI